MNLLLALLRGLLGRLGNVIVPLGLQPDYACLAFHTRTRTQAQ